MKRDHSPSSRPSAGSPRVSTASILEEFRKDIAATPQSQRLCEIEIVMDPHVARKWRDTVQKMRSVLGENLEEWEVFAIILKLFLHRHGKSAIGPTSDSEPGKV